MNFLELKSASTEAQRIIAKIDLNRKNSMIHFGHKGKKDQDRVLKTERLEIKFTCKGKPIRFKTDLSNETLQDRKNDEI